MGLKAEQIKSGRIIGNLKGAMSGPTSIFLGGMHGNEPAGVKALQKVFRELPNSLEMLKGRVIALAGNIPALKKQVRFIEKDLNRLWFPEKLEHLFNGGHHQLSTVTEYSEQMALYSEIQKIINNNPPPYYFIDLHSASSDTIPFILITDTPGNHDLAVSYPLPVIMGVEKYVKGSLLDYVNDFGYMALGFEAGEHHNAETVERHVSFTWLTLGLTGNLDKEQIPDHGLHHEKLNNAAGHSKTLFNIRYRYGVQPDEEFKMIPGFANFQPVKENDVLATNINGTILSKMNGRIFLPLYQDQGADGFFIIEKVK